MAAPLLSRPFALLLWFLVHLQVFYDYVSRSYGHFLAGDDYNCGLLDEELARTFAGENPPSPPSAFQP